MGTGIAAHGAGTIAHTARMGASGFAAGAETVFVIMALGFAAVGAPTASIPLLPIVDFCHLAVVADVYAVSVSPGMTALVSAAGAETVLIIVALGFAADDAPAASVIILPSVGFLETAGRADEYSGFLIPGMGMPTAGAGGIRAVMLGVIYAAVGAFTAQFLFHKIVFLCFAAMVANALFKAGVPFGMGAFAAAAGEDAVLDAFMGD